MTNGEQKIVKERETKEKRRGKTDKGGGGARGTNLKEVGGRARE